MTKHAPATPLPWNIVGGDKGQLTLVCKPGDGIVSHVARLHDGWLAEEHGGTAFGNAQFILRTANAYPKLVLALRNSIKELRLLNVLYDGMQRQNSPAAIAIADFSELLRELGEE